ncbi:MAG TPA: TIGR04551 family protein [Kofleriaceae bacterium]|nr:TIGR04551 family protein [Kofleriaceae bacterium]
MSHRCLDLVAVIAVGLAGAQLPAHADGFAELGAELTPRKYASPRDRTEVILHGSMRVRGEALYNLDLDRGLTPSGDPLFPVPVADPDGQTLTGADTRLRTDLAIYAPGTGVAVKLRVDVLDNLALGSTPEGRPSTGRAPSPAASPGQRPPTEAFRIKRAYGEALTPFGILAAGRMGAHWGLGLVANGGDCEDCDGGDAADRIAFVTPIAGHLWAASFDFTATGPTARRRDEARVIDLEPTDDVRSVTFAVWDQHTPLMLQRRREVGRPSLDYGAYVAHRWQDNDVPSDYLPTAQPIPLDAGQVMHRGYRATAADVWVRLTTARLRLEVEMAYVHASVDQASLVPGVLLSPSVTSNQLGLAFQSELIASPAARLGFHFGVASGDPAPGFGAFPTPNAPAAQPGDLDGPQADLPRDASVDNFRFHPDYRIDRILFREIIGTVTDAFYLRPTLAYRLLDLGTSQLDFEAALIASWALEATSTPSGSRSLGIELDPGLVYRSSDGFLAALDYAVLLPGAGFDNPAAGLDARAAQLVRLRLGYYF